MAIELRPRSADARVELDAFVACRIERAIEVERAASEHLQKHKDCPVTPFDVGSYIDILKLVAGNLDSNGIYCDVLANDEAAPEAGKHLLITNAWVLLSRPRPVNFLFDDFSVFKRD